LREIEFKRQNFLETCTQTATKALSRFTSVNLTLSDAERASPCIRCALGFARSKILLICVNPR